MRPDGRQPDEKRPVTIEPDFVRTAWGSCLIATGAAGNFMFCRSYLTEFYGEGWQTDGETIAEDPDKTVEGGDIYAWKTDDMRIWISEAAGAMTVIHYQRIR